MLEDFGKLELLEKILGLLQIHHVTPLGFSQQFEAQQSLPEKVFYVAECQRCCFIFNVEASLRAHQADWISVEILVCPPQLLAQVRQALPCSPAAVPWLSSLQAIAEDPTESSRGLLGHFSSTQMDLIESLFARMGELDPWGSIINPIWAAHLLNVEEAWDRATEPNPDLTSGETPQWGFASFALQPSTERCSQASLGETDKWIETRSVLEDTTVERFLLEGEDTLPKIE